MHTSVWFRATFAITVLHRNIILCNAHVKQTVRKMLLFSSAVISAALEWKIPTDVWVNSWKIDLWVVNRWSFALSLFDSLSTCSSFSSVGNMFVWEHWLCFPYQTGVLLLALGKVKRETVILYGNQGSSNMPLYRTKLKVLICIFFAKEIKGCLESIHLCQGKENKTVPVSLC